MKKTARSVDSANEQVESIEGKHIRDYEAAFPVATVLIMSLLEKALLHKQAIKMKQVKAEIALARRRELYRFITRLVIVLGGFVLFRLGQDLAGVIALISTAAELVGSSVGGKIRDTKTYHKQLDDASRPGPEAKAENV